jgi:hypothetical protein
MTASLDRSERDRLEAKLDQLLAPLYEAGWHERAAGSVRIDSDEGVSMVRDLVRTAMVLRVVYEPGRNSIMLAPGADQSRQTAGPLEFNFLDRPVSIQITRTPPSAQDTVREAARHVGLLDPTRIVWASESAPDDDALHQPYDRYLLSAVKEWRGDRDFKPPGKALQNLTALANQAILDGILPDPVPMTAALGIVQWCWRNTEVETWHSQLKSLTDVVMAKLAIALTRSVRAHIDNGGIGWSAVSAKLTDPDQGAPA